MNEKASSVRPAPPTSRPVSQAPARDDLAKALDVVAPFGEVLRPQDVDEPILAHGVALAVHEWLTEINHRAELATVGVQPRRLALLYGPPGTGKTTLAHHIAARLGMPLIAVASERLVSATLGGTGRGIGALFDALRPIEAHCVLLLDEFDGLAQRRIEKDTGGGAAQEMNRALTVLLRRIEAYQGIGLAATNTKDAIDPAMWRRFGLQISVDLPGEDERFAIIRKYALPFDLEDSAIDLLVAETRGASPSLLRQLMEGIKRTLVLAPKLRLDVTSPGVVIEHVTASIAPPPEMPLPPLWAGGSGAIDAMPWPPSRAGMA